MKKKFCIWESPKQAVFTLMLILMCMGAINVYSASYVAAQDMFGNGLWYLTRYALWSVIGLLGIVLVRKIGYQRLLNKKILDVAYIVVIVILILVEIAGPANKGAQRWLYLGPLSVQPSELAKLIVVMLTASTLGSLLKKGRPASLWQGGESNKLLLQVLIYAFLVYKQPDLGTAAIIVALALCQYFVAGIPWSQVTLLGLLCGVMGAVFTYFTPYRIERIRVWFNPWIDAKNTGYQMVQSLLAIGSGGLTGISWGQGSGKFFYLPEAHTDFAFAIFCQENGFLGALFLLCLFGLLAAAFIRIAGAAKDEKGFLLVCGCSFLVVGQAAANMAMVCGILPVIGVPLVFISYGGSSIIISMLAIGLILSVYDAEAKRQQLEAESKVPPAWRREGLRVVGGRRQRP